MSEKLLRRIIRIIAFMQVAGGAICLAWGLRLCYSGSKFVAEGMLTHTGLIRLTVYIWVSGAVSFLLAYGLFSLKEWSRKLLLVFVFFGWLNTFMHMVPYISSVVTIYLPHREIIEALKSVLTVSLDIFFLFFFTRSKIKALFLG